MLSYSAGVSGCMLWSLVSLVLKTAKEAYSPCKKKNFSFFAKTCSIWNRKTSRVTGWPWGQIQTGNLYILHLHMFREEDDLHKPNCQPDRSPNAKPKDGAPCSLIGIWSWSQIHTQVSGCKILQAHHLEMKATLGQNMAGPSPIHSSGLVRPGQSHTPLLLSLPLFCKMRFITYSQGCYEDPLTSHSPPEVAGQQTTEAKRSLSYGSGSRSTH